MATVAPFVYRDPALYAEIRFVRELEDALRAHDAIPIAVGSGTINDLVKLAAHRVGRPGYLCVATAASMDGYTAFGASITSEGAKQTFNCPAPRAVIADVDVIRRAPPELTASGYADLSAKITAGADWILADALGAEPIDARAWEIVQGGLRAGAAMLLLSVCPLDTPDLKDALIGTVDSAPGIIGLTITGGRLNVNSAVHSCLAPPPTPENLAATAGDNRVQLSWTASLGATRYIVKRSTTAGGP